MMEPTVENVNKERQKRPHSTARAIRYLVGKAFTIAATIFVGVFITVLLTNQPTQRGLGPPQSPFETSLEAQISLVLRMAIFSGRVPMNDLGVPDQEAVDALEKAMRDEAGLNLPYLPRYLLWTVKALTFDWGYLGERFRGWGPYNPQAGVTDIILVYMPRTLVLVGISYLLVFLFGMPLSLYLARNYGKFMDRLFAFLSPISSVPSWVFGILLIAIFAYQLRLLPFGGMFDTVIPKEPVEYVLVFSQHAILPVSAIVLSLLFQVVYAWRTFFIIYSEEDYVDLAKAKGLSNKILNRKYILRPALPYFVTSLATTLISFWQLSMALEVTFRWPGLGWLYIKEALPNFWGESMEPGELIIAIAIVVIFSYLLGAVVFLLDIFYVLVDPRIRLLPQNQETQTRERLQSRKRRLRTGNWWKKRDGSQLPPPVQTAPKKKTTWAEVMGNLKESWRDYKEKRRLFIQELRKYPSAIFGLTIIALLLVGSIYAVTAMPYEQVGREYEENRMEGRSYVPRTAMPAWVNLFAKQPHLSRLILDETSTGTQVDSRVLENGWIEKTTTFTFDYPYQEIPNEIFLYFNPTFIESPPFAMLNWIYPDGSMIMLKPSIAKRDSSFPFEMNIPITQILGQHPEWNAWFESLGLYPTPAFNLLFATPGAVEPTPQDGRYQLVVTSLLFEPGSDLNLELVILGNVYGMAGTDYARRDLLVPLFWGMPFALIIGLLGALVTTLLAMLLPAISVWYGGWVDNLIQRISEINMVLPALTIAVLLNVLFNTNIWLVLGVVVIISAFGSPIKIIRSALLQAKEAPYIEAARSYGAGDFRIITHYLLPRIFPVLIPQLVAQVPSFIFWEATLGFFNIKSNYPSWGRIIYEGLANGALYGSPFWVLEPLFLLLLTSLAFAMLGSALERILNPRTIESIPMIEN